MIAGKLSFGRDINGVVGIDYSGKKSRKAYYGWCVFGRDVVCMISGTTR